MPGKNSESNTHLPKFGPNFPYLKFQRFNHDITLARSNNSRLIVQHVYTEAGRNTFSVQAALLFNLLSEEIRNVTSYGNFKGKVINFDFGCRMLQLL